MRPKNSHPVQDITDPATRKSRLLAEKCTTCIFRAGNPMHLGPGRLADLIREALASDTYVVCHQTLTYGDHPDYGPAICRGFADAYGNRSAALLLLRSFDLITEVPPPPAANQPGDQPGGDGDARS